MIYEKYKILAWKNNAAADGNSYHDNYYHATSATTDRLPKALDLHTPNLSDSPPPQQFKNEETDI